MIRVESSKEMGGFTEFEEDILFDDDDPDFDHVHAITVPIVFKVPSNMSLASVHPAELHSSHSSLTTLSHSLDDLNVCNWTSSDQVMTIEELRNQMSSCFTCGVSWTELHVSLDCSECGGYAMERPCPKCDGACGALWKRDLASSHASSKARWQGECNNVPSSENTKESATTPPPTATSNNNTVAQELCNRLEKLNANS